MLRILNIIQQIEEIEQPVGENVIENFEKTMLACHFSLLTAILEL